MGFLVAFFVAVAELWVLVAVARRIGVLGTVALLVLCILVGLHIVRTQGMGILRKLREEPGDGNAQLLTTEGGLLLVAAVLLLIPGFLTSLAGILLLIPAVRFFAARHMPRRAAAWKGGRTVFFDMRGPGFRQSKTTYESDRNPGVIEVEAKIVEPGSEKKKDPPA